MNSQPNHPVEYKDADDGLHPQEADEYYEWWYFDARFDNGYSCVITFHWRNAFLRPRIPTIQIFVYTPNGERYIGMSAFEPKDCTAELDICDVRMGESTAKLVNGAYRVSINARGIGAELIFERLLPGWKQDGGFLDGDEKAGQGWIVCVPKAQVEGKLYIEGKTVSVKGEGYHDHNWGKMNIYDSFRGWYWGRLYDPNYTMIYYHLYPVDETRPPISRLYLAQGNTPVLTANQLEISLDKEESDKEMGKPIPLRILLNCSEGKNLQFQCNLETTRVVEREEFPKVTDWPQYHWRFLANYNIEHKTSDSLYKSSGIAIHEHLLFR